MKKKNSNQTVFSRLKSFKMFVDDDFLSVQLEVEGLKEDNHYVALENSKLIVGVLENYQGEVNVNNLECFLLPKSEKLSIVSKFFGDKSLRLVLARKKVQKHHATSLLSRSEMHSNFSSLSDAQLN